MCLAVPSRIVSIAGDMAEVEAFAIRRKVSLALLEGAPDVGDYVLVRAGGYAVETVERERALEALAAFAADGLETAFRRIERENMQGVAMLNPALRVEALGFGPWDEHWLGVLVTPWFVNLVLVRGSVEHWSTAPDGEPVTHEFPCGQLAFLPASEPEVGDFQTCALSTEMHRFPGQDAAREFALAALEAAKQAPPQLGAAGPVKRREPMSKRHFLRSLVPGTKLA